MRGNKIFLPHCSVFHRFAFLNSLKCGQTPYSTTLLEQNAIKETFSPESIWVGVLFQKDCNQLA
jgi:hypothetical protein